MVVDKNEMGWCVFEPKPDCHFPGNIYNCIFLRAKFCILIQISLKFVREGPAGDMSGSCNNALSPIQYQAITQTWHIYMRWEYSWTTSLILTLIARFMGPTWGPSGADRTQVGPMLAPRTLLSEKATDVLNHWYWPHRINQSFSSRRKDFNCLHHLNIEKL